jgi:uncharacterized lipoprotein NlpE involved in copper resistance
MKYLLIASFVVLLNSCQRPNEGESEETSEMIIDLKTLTGSLEETTQLLGTAIIEEHKGYPCESQDCKKAYFMGDSIEILYEGGKPITMTFNKTGDYTRDRKAIRLLGLAVSKPSEASTGNYIRWQDVEGFKEIAFNNDFIYVRLK